MDAPIIATRNPPRESMLGSNHERKTGIREAERESSAAGTEGVVG